VESSGFTAATTAATAGFRLMTAASAGDDDLTEVTLGVLLVSFLGNPRVVFRPPQPHTWLGRAHWIRWHLLFWDVLEVELELVAHSPLRSLARGPLASSGTLYIRLNCPASVLPMLTCPYSRFTPWPS
jgi:hypothetical protein